MPRRRLFTPKRRLINVNIRRQEYETIKRCQRHPGDPFYTSLMDVMNALFASKADIINEIRTAEQATLSWKQKYEDLQKQKTYQLTLE